MINLALIISVIMLDICQTGVTSISWHKWFTETVQTLLLVGYTAVCATTRALLANILLPSLA